MTSPQNPQSPQNPDQPGSPYSGAGSASPYSAPGAGPASPYSAAPSGAQPPASPVPPGSNGPGGPQPGPSFQPSPYAQPGPYGPGSLASGGMQVGPGGPGPNGPGQPPAPGPGGPAKAKKSTLGLLIGIGVLVIALIGGSIFVLVTRKTPEQQAEAAAKDLMQAYAAGDADKVKGYLDLGPDTDQSLLTNEVLKEAVKKAPITDIKVPSAKSGVRTFTVNFKAGDKTATLRVTAPSSGVVKVTSTLPTLNLSRLESLPVTVNGKKPDSPRPAVLPGGYTVGFDSPNYTLPEPDMTVISPATLPAPQLSEAGLTAFRTRLKEAVTACLAEKSLEWTCGPKSTTSNPALTLSDGTVQRTVAPEELAKLDEMKVRVESSRPHLARPEGTLPKVDVRVTCTNNGTSGECSSSVRFKTPRIDMTQSDLPVTWS
ncbi:MAG: hypothetical protein Q4G45_00210 [Actinomycetia bacterium]|nr:hypothetical protein [Actinomycetes bacterium]